MNTNRSYWNAKEAFWLLCLILISNIWGVEFTASLLGKLALNSSEVLVFSGAGGAVLSIILMYYLVKLRCPNEIARYLAFTKIKTSNVVIKYFTLYAVYLAFTYIVTLFSNLPEDKELLNSFVDMNYIVSVGLISCLLIPIAEEMLFRGFLFKSWETSTLGAYKSIFIISLIFTFLHAGQYEISVIIVMFPLAVLLSFARYHSGSLWLPIAIHVFHNSLVYLLTYQTFLKLAEQ